MLNFILENGLPIIFATIGYVCIIFLILLFFRGSHSYRTEDRENIENSMRIKHIYNDYVVFDNGNYLTFAHKPIGNEKNYADFDNAFTKKNGAFDFRFNKNNLTIQFIPPTDIRVPKEGIGFLIDERYFIPCYSIQKGNYPQDIILKYHRKDGSIIKSVKGECNLRFE